MTENNTPDPSTETTQQGKSIWESPRNIRILQYVVIALGIILIAGFVTVIGRIIYLMTKTSTTAPRAVVGTALEPIEAPFGIDLPDGAQVTEMSLDKLHMALRYSSPGKEGIVIVDIATGKVVRRLELRPAR